MQSAPMNSRMGFSGFLDSPRQVSRTLIAVCVLMLNTFCSQASAQEKVSETNWKRGYHGFNMVCDGIGLSHVTISEAYGVPQNELVVVVFGDTQRIPFLLENVISNGGAVLVATDSSKTKNFGVSGIRFRSHGAYPTLSGDTFADFDDCPVVSDIRAHFITEGVNEIATNRPGALVSNLNSRRAYLTYPDENAKAFIATMEYRNGSRVVGVADQSVFSNQMIIYRDNALFTDQTLRWLKGKNRKYVVVVSDGAAYTHLDPADVELVIPPPTSDEIVDAIKNLPPTAMLEFANSVMTVVEDDDLVNDFIHDEVDKVSDGKYNRFLIFLMFGIVCLSFVVAFLFQKKLMRQTGSQVAAEKSRRAQKQQKTAQARERQWAAHVLLDSFCVDLANRYYNDWPGFPLGFEMQGNRDSQALFKEMAKASNLYKSKPSSYWSRSRLRQLEHDTIRWRAWFAEHGNPLANLVEDVVDSEVATSGGVVDSTIVR